MNTGQWPVLNEYWTSYQRYSFSIILGIIVRVFVFSIFVSYQTVGQGGKEFFNVFL